MELKERIIAASQQVDNIEQASETAEEAKSAVESGGDPQLAAIVKLQVSTMDLTGETCDELAQFRDYWPEWKPDTEYKFQQPLTYNGKYYRTSRALTSQSTYPPDTAGESEYYPIEIADDGIVVYRTCHGSYDAVQKGERRHYPDANGKVYESLVDNNAYSPEAYPANWKLVS